MNDYYQFKVYVISDDTEETKKCDQVLKLINQYDFAYQSLDVTSDKEGCRKQMKTPYNNQFPFLVCEGEVFDRMDTLEGFLQMIKLSPCYVKGENSYLKLEE